MTRPGGPLEALSREVERDLDRLGLPAKPWMPATARIDGRTALDVAVIGAGMAGLAAAAALNHLGIGAVAFDERPGGREGPWVTSARMETLRSPKALAGPALGIPSLTFRAWFEAQFGAAEWERLGLISRVQWMEYLVWYRKVLKLDVRNGHRIRDIVPRDGHVLLAVETPDGAAEIAARRVVLATGRDGLGGPVVPAPVRKLPPESWMHSSDVRDLAGLSGKHVAVIGAGASAMDNAAAALEAGAASVELVVRRPDLPRVNKVMAMGNPGHVHGYVDLPPEWKRRLQSYLAAEPVPPPRPSVLRVSRHDNVRVNFDCAVLDARRQDGRVRLETSKGGMTVDFVICATGFGIDWARRPFLANIAGHVRSWGDSSQDHAGEAAGDLSLMPELGPAFEFLPKFAGGDPNVGRVHCFCQAAAGSHGNVAGDIPAISDGALRLARGIASLFYREDIEAHFRQIVSHEAAELRGDEWTPAACPTEGTG